MSDYRRHEIVSGLFILGAVVVFALFAFRVGDVDLFGLLQPEQRLFRVHFTDVRTLDEGAKVTIAGRRVGSVVALRFDDRPFTEQRVQELVAQYGEDAFPGLQAGMLQPQIEVVFALEDPSVRLDPRTARVSLAQDGLLGRHYLALDPGYWPADGAPRRVLELEAGAPLELPAQPTAGLEQLLAAVRPAVRKLDALLGALQREVLNEEGAAKAREAIANLAGALSGLNELLDRSRPDGLQQMVVEPMRRVLEHADRSLENATLLLDESRPKLQAVLDELARATAGLDGELETMRADLRHVLAELGDAIDENRPELAETMRRLRRTMWQAEMAMRKIRANPAYLLFGDDETDFEAQPRDLSETWRSGRARPYRQRDERDGK